MFLILAAVVAGIIIILAIFAKGLDAPPATGGGAGAGAGDGFGQVRSRAENIVLVHAGGFAPYEFVFEGEVRGISPDFARMLVDKGYYKQAGCPGEGFFFEQDPRFSSIVTTASVFGKTYQIAGPRFGGREFYGRHRSTCGVVGDWGNTTARRRFAQTSSAYIKSGVNKVICDSTGASCPTLANWDGTQTVVFASGFVNSPECLDESITQDFQQQFQVVANNSDLVSIIEGSPGTFTFVPEGIANAFASTNPNGVVLSVSAKCSPGWGFFTNPECVAEAECLTRANKLVTPEDYNRHCCQYRNTKYDAAYPDWVADNGITFGESAFNVCIDNRANVDDEGGPELSIAFNECGNHFCDRPGDAACP
ncbi:MAG: hypothetical protein LC650_04105 [Actinobacteria bacterium]|nr:hypothetical protein [Actinomycetota bacterium]